MAQLSSTQLLRNMRARGITPAQIRELTGMPTRSQRDVLAGHGTGARYRAALADASRRTRPGSTIRPVPASAAGAAGYPSQATFDRAWRQSGLQRSTQYRRDLRTARANGMTEQEFRAVALRLSRAPRKSGRNGAPGRGAPVDESPDGPLAEYLTAIGRRNGDWDFGVGDSPSLN